jgi:hypothetical protein
MQYLKADTQVKVVIGPCVAIANGYVPVTTLSLSTADEAEILKHDAGSVTDISGNTFAAITSADGYYNLTITAAQLDTEGTLSVIINDDSLCLPLRHDFMVVNANVFDSLFAAATTDYLQVDTIQLSSDAGAADNAEAFFDGTGYAGTNNVIPTVTTLTNLPTIPTNWLTAAGTAADFGTEVGTAVWASATRVLTANTNLNDLDAAGVATAVWNAATITYGGAGTYGQAVEDTLADTADIQPNYATSAELAKVPKSDGTTSWNATALAAINAQVDTAFTDYDPPTKTEMDTGFSNLNDPTAAAIADAVLDEATAGHTTAGTLGKAVIDILADTNELQSDDVPGLIATVQADLDTITGTDGVTLATAQALYAPAKAGDNMGTVSSVTGNVDGNVTGNVSGNVTGSVGSNLELGPAEVNAEVVDVLKTDTMTQSSLCPQEAPPVNATIEEAIAYLYKAWRNKSTQTATTYSLFADDTTTVDQKSTVSDNGTTATKGEVITGL